MKPADFTFAEAKYMTARQKQLVLGDWLRFLKSGLAHKQFSKRLYNHLIQHCSFIAHYNREGFYSTYFRSGDDVVRFLSQFDGTTSCSSVEYGWPWWQHGEYEDLNRAMIEVATPLIPDLKKQVFAAQEATDVAQATALLAKYGRKVS